MPASRLYSGVKDFLDWMWENDASLAELFMPTAFNHLVQSNEETTQLQEQQNGSDTAKYPEVLPILPLRGVVVYPQTAVPLTVGQPRSIKLVDDVVGGDKLGGLVAALNPELETPGPADLYRVGTIC